MEKGYKLYVHEGKGHYIGSCVIVIAGSLMMAEKVIRQSLAFHLQVRILS
jgi:hypothetical protein